MIFWVITSLNSEAWFPSGAAAHTKNKMKKKKKANSDRTKQKDPVGLSALEVVLFHLIKAHLSPNTLRLKLHPELVEAPLSAIPDKENTATIIHGGEMIRASSPWG